MSTSTDPVSGMKVDSESGRSMEHAGQAARTGKYEIP